MISNAPGIPPKYWGQITITTGTNDTIHWSESDGVPNSYNNLSTIIAQGSYYPDALITLIQNQMNAVSTASGLGQAHAGVGATYTVTADNATGEVRFSIAHASAPNPQFQLHLTTGVTRKFLTGGDATVDNHGRNHFGFNVTPVDEPPLNQHLSVLAHSNAWYPSEPRSGPNADDEGQPHSTAAQFVSMGGRVVTYDFSGDTANLDVRNVGYEWLLDADRTQYRDEFWRPYAKAGNRFRYYVNRTVTGTNSFVEMVLTENSIQEAPFTRMINQGLWSFSHKMRRYVA